MTLVLQVPRKKTAPPRAAWSPPTVTKVRTASDLAWDCADQKLSASLLQALIGELVRHIGPEGMAALIRDSAEREERYATTAPTLLREQAWLTGAMEDLRIRVTPEAREMLDRAYDRDWQRRQVAHA